VKPNPVNINNREQGFHTTMLYSEIIGPFVILKSETSSGYDVSHNPTGRTVWPPQLQVIDILAKKADLMPDTLKNMRALARELQRTDDNKLWLKSKWTTKELKTLRKMFLAAYETIRGEM
jgi:hypothetical protein